MKKVLRLTESDLVKLVAKIIKEDEGKESSNSSVPPTLEQELHRLGFKKKPSEEFYWNYYSARPEPTPNLSCRIQWRKKFDSYDPNGGFIQIKFNRVVQKAEGYWTDNKGTGPITKLDKIMDYDYDMKGISTLTKYNANMNDLSEIIRLYDRIKFQ